MKVQRNNECPVCGSAKKSRTMVNKEQKEMSVKNCQRLTFKSCQSYETYIIICCNRFHDDNMIVIFTF